MQPLAAPSTPIRQDGRDLILRVRVHPRARRTALAGVHDGQLKVSVQAPPADGAANEALLRFLAREILGVPLARVQIERGAASHDKQVRILDFDLTTARQALGL